MKNINAAVLSSNLDTLLSSTYVFITLPMNNFKPKMESINLFIDRSSVGDNSNLIQYAKNEEKSILK